MRKEQIIDILAIMFGVYLFFNAKNTYYFRRLKRWFSDKMAKNIMLIMSIILIVGCGYRLLFID